jgi:hypothetical protein
MRTILGCLLCCCTLPCTALLAQSTPPDRPPFDTVAIREHTRYLASDELLGRATAKPGAHLAAEYIEAACRALGLEPIDSQYAHPVPLRRTTIIPEGTVLTSSYGETMSTEFPFPDQLTWDLASASSLTDFGGRAVYAGSNSEIPALAEFLALDSAVAVTMGPVAVDRVRLLADRGAVAVIQLVPDDAQFAFFRDLRGTERLYPTDSSVILSLLPPIPTLVLGIEASQSLLRSASRGIGGRPHFNTAIRARLRARHDEVASHNVGCMLPGTDVADSVIVFTAHYDHLGIGPPDATGDTIYNGFSDNAAGVAMLLAVADALHRDGALRHSIAFLFFTGEELGLLGSDYFAAHPPLPLDRITAVINLDAGAPPGKPSGWRVAGHDTPLRATAEHVGAVHGLDITTSDATPNSDYYPFARAGVDAVFVIPGPGPYQGMTHAESDSLRARWDRYHQAGDEWDSEFPLEGLAAYAEFAMRIAIEVDGERGAVER